VEHVQRGAQLPVLCGVRRLLLLLLLSSPPAQNVE